MDVCLLCLYDVLSCVDRRLCDGLITRPEESYRMSVCVITETPKGALCSKLGTTGKWINIWVSAGKKFRNKRNFGYRIPVHFKHWSTHTFQRMWLYSPIWRAIYDHLFQDHECERRELDVFVVVSFLCSWRPSVEVLNCKYTDVPTFQTPNPFCFGHMETPV
jgi:hypothetical protein